MVLEHAILGFLNYRPMTGYDLKKIFDTSVRHFWPAKQSQIYRTLASMAESGWVTMEVVEQTDRPDRKVYSITAAGREELRRWLITPMPFGENRSAPLVQVFFAGQLADEEIIAIFEHAAAQIRTGLEQYATISQRPEDYNVYTNSPREFFFWMLTLETGFATAKANLEIIERVIQTIRNGELPSN